MKRLGEILANDQSLASTTSSGADALATGGAAPGPRPAPACARCDDAGFLRLRREPSHPEFGQVVPCECTEREMAARRTRALQRFSNLGPLTEIGFVSLDPEWSPLSGAAIEAARAFAFDETRQGRWMLIWGAPGAGKTSLAAAMANERLHAGQPALYFVLADLLDRLRAAYQADAALPYPRLFDDVRNAPFLVLDDVDLSNPTGWAEEKLFQLLNHRWNAKLPTVALLNRRPEELKGLQRELLDRRTEMVTQELRRPEEGVEMGGYRQIGGMTRERLSRFRFESFRLEGNNLSDEEAENLALIRSMVREWAQSPRGWLILLGSTGVGKTHLAAAVANERLAAGDSVCFAVVPDLLDYLRRAYSPQAGESYDTVFDALRDIPLLILDDLGAHSTTPWAEEKLYQLLSYRHTRVLPTVVTTNLNPDEFPPRFSSRLFDHQISKPYELIWRDYRTGLSPKTAAKLADASSPRGRRKHSGWEKPRW